ncbi:mechanosensitive ion channel domain-containing protein [Limibacter armeniacum]|uniref:mechanosensitive ion channel family protein n=1 Tax=Limibacter armeniacum TaxID=466084 RepID=UPI002FE69F72
MNLSLQEFLNYPLFEFQGKSFTPFQLVIIALLVVFFKFVGRIVYGRVERFMHMQSGIDIRRAGNLLQVMKYLSYVVLVILVLQILDLDVSLFLAGSAALLVGVGLGLQQVFYDLAAGLFILFEGQVNNGDVVEIDGLVGRVQKIGFRTSLVVTKDEIVIIIPNSKFITDNVVNWSEGNNSTRFKIKVGVAYGSDLKLVRDTLLQCAYEHKSVTKHLEPVVIFSDFGNSSLDFELYFWSEDVWRMEVISSELRFRIDELFRERGVVVPFPQQDLHIVSSSVPLS